MLQEPVLDKSQRELLKELNYSPIKKYTKQGKFPIDVLLTLGLIVLSTCQMTSLSYSRYSNQREIQDFFSYHILKHQYFDIYEGPEVNTFRTHELRTFEQTKIFFGQMLEFMLAFGSAEFHTLDQDAYLRTKHSVAKQYRNGTFIGAQMELQEIEEAGIFTTNLKEYLVDMVQLRILFTIHNMTEPGKDVEVKLQFELKQKFMLMVRLDTSIHSHQIDYVYGPSPNQQEPGNLQIRKVPHNHDTDITYLRIGFLFSSVLIVLTMLDVHKRYCLYKESPFEIEEVCCGKPFKELSLKQRLCLLGWWNICIILLNFGCLFSGIGLTCLFSWVQLARYLQFTDNPYLLSFLFRQVLPVILIVYMNVYIVLTGFVFISMVVFTQTKKFESVRLSYFEYLFNNYMYGIYENFIALGKYTGYTQFGYFLLLFYMVMMANNMIPGILCNHVISRGRYEELQDILKNIKIPCPVCSNVTNSRKNGTNTSKPFSQNSWMPTNKDIKNAGTSQAEAQAGGGLQAVDASQAQQSAIDLAEEEEISLVMKSPALSPFFTPNRSPNRAIKPGHSKANSPIRSRKTLFKISQGSEAFASRVPQSQPILVFKGESTSRPLRFELAAQKLQFLVSKFETLMLEWEILWTNQHADTLASKLIQQQYRVTCLSNKVNKHPQTTKNITKTN